MKQTHTFKTQIKKFNYKILLLPLTLASLTTSNILANAENLSTANFTATLEGTDLPVVIDFWAPWCAPCLTLAPTIDQLAKQTQGRAIVAKVNIDENPNLAQTYGVQSIPTILFIKKGTVLTQLRGVHSIDTLMTTLESSMGGKSDTSASTNSVQTKGRSMIDKLIEVTSSN